MTEYAFNMPSELKGTVQGTMLYLMLYSGIMLPFQAFSKFYLMKQKTKTAAASSKNKIDFRKVKYYNSTDHLALVGDRTVGQFVEYTILFLPLLWLHALFVQDGADQSLPISVLYCITRAFYPIVFGYRVYPGVLWSAIPNYAILAYLQVRIIVAVF